MASEISHLTWLKSIVGKDLTDAEARELFMISHRERFVGGDHLFDEGEPAAALFLIADGEVDIVKKVVGTNPHTLATHGGGAIVGEMSLLTREQRSASAVIRSDDATVLRVTWKDLDQLLQREPAVAYKLMASLARMLAGRLKAVNTRLTELAAKTPNNNPYEQIEEFQAFKKKLFSDWSF
jgi:CRP-like cAMP-binding protein